MTELAGFDPSIARKGNPRQARGHEGDEQPAGHVTRDDRHQRAITADTLSAERRALAPIARLSSIDCSLFAVCSQLRTRALLRSALRQHPDADQKLVDAYCQRPRLPCV